MERSNKSTNQQPSLYPDLVRCSTCGEFIPEGTYYAVLLFGGVACESCLNKSFEANAERMKEWNDTARAPLPGLQ